MVNRLQKMEKLVISTHTSKKKEEQIQVES